MAKYSFAADVTIKTFALKNLTKVLFRIDKIC